MNSGLLLLTEWKVKPRVRDTLHRKPFFCGSPFDSGRDLYCENKRVGRGGGGGGEGGERGGSLKLTCELPGRIIPRFRPSVKWGELRDAPCGGSV